MWEGVLWYGGMPGDYIVRMSFRADSKAAGLPFIVAGAVSISLVGGTISDVVTTTTSDGGSGPAAIFTFSGDAAGLETEGTVEGRGYRVNHSFNISDIQAGDSIAFSGSISVDDTTGTANGGITFSVSIVTPGGDTVFSATQSVGANVGIFDDDIDQSYIF